ncbi:MAG: HAD family phosphatase [Ruminococcaceae bacterium]|nr:HAD family phosphatase [Oscillospiraceae bacterium]
MTAMKTKLLASDFDGTLCHSYAPENYPATAEVLAAIRQFRTEGNLFGVVTGRDWRWSYYELKKNGKLDFDFIIALNGAQVYDSDGNLIMETTADGSADVGGMTLAHALAVRCWALVGDYFAIIRGRDRYHFSAQLPEGGEYDGDIYSPHTLLDSIGCFHMASAIAEHGTDITPAAEHLVREFGSHMNPQPNGRCMDIPPRGIDKGIAIAKYARQMGVAHDSIWTAGDNHNDIAMLTPFHGCAMENGVQAAKDAAEYVCRDLVGVIEQISHADNTNPDSLTANTVADNSMIK